MKHLSRAAAIGGVSALILSITLAQTPWRPRTVGTWLRADIDGRPSVIETDGISITLDQTKNPPQLTAAAMLARVATLEITVNQLSQRVSVLEKAPGTTVREKTDVFGLISITATITLTETPIPESLEVHLSGIGLYSPGDYTLSGKVITFASGQPTATGDIVKAKYRY
jgi:hypothetical protein